MVIFYIRILEIIVMNFPNLRIIYTLKDMICSKGGINLSEILTQEQLKMIGENCSQYKPEHQGTTAVMGIYKDEGVSCNTCRHWSGSECTIDALDNVAVNLGILPED